MIYYSTRDQYRTHGASLQEAILKGLADDGGLYMPEHIPQLSKDFISTIHQYSLQEIACTVAQAFVGKAIPTDILKSMVEETMNFNIPLVQIEESVYSLELFHGPTMAFKDVGASFMARLMSYFASEEKKELKIIAATSGDTGSAVAAGFYEVPGINVYILYPQGKVSPLQEKQLTTWGGNITAIEIKGSFDDCQHLAKQLLSDKELNIKNALTSANSINIARLIPQTFYYFWAYAQLSQLEKPIVISVPSGNFGNLTAGILAKLMGLPIEHFIAATNANDVVPEFLQTGIYNARPSVQTISNAMDVGNPSNFERLNYLFKGQIMTFKKYISSYSHSDVATASIMQHVYTNTGYILDPHGAVAYLGLKKHLVNSDTIGIFLETAHPAKFKEVVEHILDKPIGIPEKLEVFSRKEKHAITCKNDLLTVKRIIATS